MSRRIDSDIDDLIEAWELLHPADEEERAAHKDPMRSTPRSSTGADYVFASHTRYRIDAPGT